MTPSARMRVALIVPNFTWGDWDVNTKWHYIPYALAMIAAMVEDRCEIRIIDAQARDLSPEAFTAELAAFDPELVGISVLVDQYQDAGHRASALIKTWKPSVPVVMGGVYATLNTVEILKRDPHVDYVVSGEGEHVFRDLIRHFQGEGDLPAKGVAYRRDGAIVFGGRADLIKDLDALPLPAYHLIDYPRYVQDAPERRSVDMPPLFPYGRLQTSRGCPFTCSFCQVESISGRAFRSRSTARILEEIRWLKEAFGVRSLVFDDDNLLHSRARAMELFQAMVDQGLAMPWVSIATAAFKLDAELLALMRKSGCEYIDIAVESGVKRVTRDIIHKPINHDHVRKVARLAQEAGIFVAANFIVGFPGETWDEIRQTLRYAEDLNADYVKIFIATPLPQTKLWQICEETGSFRRDFTKQGVRWHAGQIETADFSADDTSILRAFEWDRINFTDPERRKRIAARMRLSEAELLAVRRRTLAGVARSLAENAPVERPVSAGV